MSDASERNRQSWNAAADEYQARHGEQLDRPLHWGVWATPEAELGVLGDCAGKDVLEYGCGGAQWSVFLAARGARVVGLDGSEAQLRHARRRVRASGVEVPLVQANGERIPLGDASFDVVFCDHGVMSWADPLDCVPEAARVLRAGGLFAFNMSSPLHDVCWSEPEDDVGERLVRSYFGMHALEDENGVCFQLPYGEWIRLFRQSGFVVEDLIEIRPREDADSSYQGYVTRTWARRWPAENIWKLRRGRT